MARPSISLTPEIEKNLCEALRIGASLELAAHYAGISSRTLSRWLQRAKNEQESEFWQFCRSIKKARAEFAIGSLLKIERASAKEWTAAAWKLERLFPDTYGKQSCRRADSIEAILAVDSTQHDPQEDGDQAD